MGSQMLRKRKIKEKRRGRSNRKETIKLKDCFQKTSNLDGNLKKKGLQIVKTKRESKQKSSREEKTLIIETEAESCGRDLSATERRGENGDHSKKRRGTGERN